MFLGKGHLGCLERWTGSTWWERGGERAADDNSKARGLGTVQWGWDQTRERQTAMG